MGSIEQTGAVEDVKSEKDAESNLDSKNGVKPSDSDKTKTKRKLYVGSQALGYRRDFMEVRLAIIFSTHIVGVILCLHLFALFNLFIYLIRWYHLLKTELLLTGILLTIYGIMLSGAGLSMMLNFNCLLYWATIYYLIGVLLFCVYLSLSHKLYYLFCGKLNTEKNLNRTSCVTCDHCATF